VTVRTGRQVAATARATARTTALSLMTPSGRISRGRRASTALAASPDTARPESRRAPRPAPPNARSPSSGAHAVSVPSPAHESTEVAVARASGGVRGAAYDAESGGEIDGEAGGEGGGGGGGGCGPDG
jgi:hypothetical protein